LNYFGEKLTHGRSPLTSLYEMIRYVRFMYVYDLASTHFLWRSHTSFLGLHPYIDIDIDIHLD